MGKGEGRTVRGVVREEYLGVVRVRSNFIWIRVKCEKWTLFCLKGVKDVY